MSAHCCGPSLREVLEGAGGRNIAALERSNAHWLTQSAFLHTLDPIPGGDTTHSELGPLTSMTDQEGALQTCPHHSPT